MNPVKGAVAGAVGGLAGAYVMGQFQSWWLDLEKRAAPKRRAHAAKDGATDKAPEEPATVQVAERLAEKLLDSPLPEAMKPKAGEAVHYATGGLIGAAYGIAAEMLAPARWANGMAFGSVVWWVADNMAVPAQGLGKKPEQVPPSKHAYALASHLVYGLVTELVRRIVRIVL